MDVRITSLAALTLSLASPVCLSAQQSSGYPTRSTTTNLSEKRYVAAGDALMLLAFKTEPSSRSAGISPEPWEAFGRTLLNFSSPTESRWMDLLCRPRNSSLPVPVLYSSTFLRPAGCKSLALSLPRMECLSCWWDCRYRTRHPKA